MHLLLTILPNTSFSHLALTPPNYGFGTSPGISLCLLFLTLVISAGPVLGSGLWSAHSLCAHEKRCVIFLVDAAMSQGHPTGKQSIDQISESTDPSGLTLKYRAPSSPVHLPAILKFFHRPALELQCTKVYNLVQNPPKEALMMMIRRRKREKGW